MAEIRIRNTNERIQGEEQVKAFLDQQEVLYEHWNPGKLSAELQEKFVLTDEEKAAILSTYKEEIEDLASRRGYLTWDVIALSDATPNLDELLKKNSNRCIPIRRTKYAPSPRVKESLLLKGQTMSAISM